MKVECPNCGFTSRIDDAKVPEKPVQTRCKKCSHRFVIQKGGRKKAPAPKPTAETPTAEKAPPPPAPEKPAKDTVICPKCRHGQHPSPACVYCGTPFPDFKKPESPKAETAAESAPREPPKMPPRQAMPTPEPSQARPPKGTINCPYCAEPIREDAKKCKHCGERLTSLPEEDRERLGLVEAVRGIVDFSFTTFVTPTLIKVLYIAGLVIGALSALVMMGLGIFRGDFLGGWGAFGILGVLLGFAAWVISARVYAELALILFRIEENTRGKKGR